jgi:hypothetical protein
MAGLRIPNMTELERIRLLESAEATAYKQLLNFAPKQYNTKVFEVAGATLLITPSLPIVLFNRVLNLGVDHQVSQAELITIREIYTESGVQSFLLQPSPKAFSAQTTAWLETQQVTQSHPWVKMYRRAEAIDTEQPVEIELIKPEEALRFASVCLAGFSMPPMMLEFTAAGLGQQGWQHYIAKNDIGSAAMCIQNQVAWLGMGSTLATHRNQGVQISLMARRTTDAARLGCTWVTTETDLGTSERPNPSHRNMLRLGFQEGYVRKNYLWRLPS